MISSEEERGKVQYQQHTKGHEVEVKKKKKKKTLDKKNQPNTKHKKWISLT